MQILTRHLEVHTKGHTDILDITEEVAQVLQQSGLKEGSITIFVSGSTAGITTIEFEPGLLKDLPEAFEILAPVNKRYHHDDTWHDRNGYAHIRASLLGPSLTVPFVQTKLSLGTWQQIVLVDFDNRSRTRQLVVQLMGE